MSDEWQNLNDKKKKSKHGLRGCLYWVETELYNSISITHNPNIVGPTKKKTLFGLVFECCFHHSKLKNSKVWVWVMKNKYTFFVLPKVQNCVLVAIWLLEWLRPTNHPTSSGRELQLLHWSMVPTCCRARLTIVGRASLQTLQAKCLTLFRTRSFQRPLQKDFWGLKFELLGLLAEALQANNL